MSTGRIQQLWQSVVGQADSGVDPADGPMIEVNDLTVRFGPITALSSVSMAVSDGQFIGLVGPNGSGKTTLIRAIAGVLQSETGSVTVAGRSVTGVSSRSVSRSVAVVPQDTSLTFDFPVRDIVSMGRTPYVSRLGRAEQSDRQAVNQALERTAIRELADRSISEVSGGERQRVFLARALAQDTPVLLLDEPTASLDINHQIRTLELVRDLADDGKTVVAAIHDLNLAAHYCDELVLLGDGRTVASGPPADVLTEDHLESVFGTRAVVTRHPVTGSTLVMALPEQPTADPTGRVHVIGGGGSAARILYLLSAAGFEVSVGALNHGDADLETANMLGIEAVTVEPFGSVPEATRKQVETAITDADVTIVADIEVGEGNLANLRAAKQADDLVIVEERPFAERNYAGQTAVDVYQELLELGSVVEPEAIIRHVMERIDDRE